MEKKALKDNGLKACESCSYWYDDGFCMQHCYYTEGAYYCPKWTDKAIDFDYNRVYRLCQQYIDICHRFKEHEKLKEKNPDKHLSMSNLSFFLNCCCNDLAREFSIKNLRNEYLMNNIRVYEDLLEKINNGEFRNQKIKK